MVELHSVGWGDLLPSDEDRWSEGVHQGPARGAAEISFGFGLVISFFGLVVVGRRLSTTRPKG
jgi:hypothetical protein